MAGATFRIWRGRAGKRGVSGLRTESRARMVSRRVHKHQAETAPDLACR